MKHVSTGCVATVTYSDLLEKEEHALYHETQYTSRLRLY